MMGQPGTAAGLLSTIVAATRRIVEVRSGREPLSTLAARAAEREPVPGRFLAALGPRTQDGRAATSDRRRMPPRIIAECKRRSPSRGVLRAHYDPAAIAASYERAGAAAVSVLTEPTFFDGSLDHLRSVRDAVGLPLLRKDFIVSDYQLFEARAAGADAVLLIAAALEPRELAGLHARAVDLGLDVLVEVHSRDELSAAVDVDARAIGVNNRNLQTLDVDVCASETLAAHLPRDVVAVSESGLRTAADIARLEDLGYYAFLIGERFMAAADPGAALESLLERSGSGEASASARRIGRG